MTKIAGILSNKVLSLATATTLGYIKDVYFSQGIKNIVYFEIYDDNLETSFLLPYDNIKNIADVITVDDRLSLVEIDDFNTSNLITNLMGKSVFSQYGEFKGNVIDVECTNNARVSRLILDNSTITPQSIATVNDAILLKANVKPTKKKAKLPRPKEDYPVYLLSNDVATQKVSTIDNANNDILSNDSDDKLTQQGKKIVSPSIHLSSLTNAPSAIALQEGEPMLSQNALKNLVGNDFDKDHNPTRVICNYDFLIGRVLYKDLYSFSGMLIAKSGSKIDEHLLSIARREGKLVELTLNSKK